MPGSPDGDATFASWGVGHAPDAARPSRLQRRHGTLARDDANETGFAFPLAVAMCSRLPMYVPTLLAKTSQVGRMKTEPCGPGWPALRNYRHRWAIFGGLSTPARKRDCGSLQLSSRDEDGERHPRVVRPGESSPRENQFVALPSRQLLVTWPRGRGERSFEPLSRICRPGKTEVAVRSLCEVSPQGVSQMADECSKARRSPAFFQYDKLLHWISKHFAFLCSMINFGTVPDAP